MRCVLRARQLKGEFACVQSTAGQVLLQGNGYCVGIRCGIAVAESRRYAIPQRGGLVGLIIGPALDGQFAVAVHILQFHAQSVNRGVVGNAIVGIDRLGLADGIPMHQQVLHFLGRRDFLAVVVNGGQRKQRGLAMYIGLVALGGLLGRQVGKQCGIRCLGFAETNGAECHRAVGLVRAGGNFLTVFIGHNKVELALLQSAAG